MLWLALGLVAAVALVVIRVVSLGGDDSASGSGSGSGSGSEGYTAEVEQEFVDSCVREAGEGSTSRCQCTYDELEANVPFERFTELDSELAGFAEGDELPQELLDAVSACS
jgi:hypothetical protein